MFRDIKGGHVMISVGGKFKTVNIAVHDSIELGLYAKVNGNWYSAMNTNGTLSNGYGWKALHLPATYNRLPDSPFGRVKVECVATKVRRKLLK